MNPEHPPLLKEIAALPLAVLGSRVTSPFTFNSWGDYNEWQFARDFLYKNKLPADTVLFLGRLPMMLLSILLGIYIFRWTRELFGIRSGLFSLALYCFAPNIIAHGRYITTDVGMAAFFFITIYYFTKYLKSPTWKYLLLSAMFCGLAQASKFSAIILFIILPLLFIIRQLYVANFPSFGKTLKKMLQMMVIFLGTTYFILFIVYGLEIKRPIDDFDVKKLYTQQDTIIKTNSLAEQNPLVQRLISITNTNTKSGTNIRWVADHFPIPAYTYFRGLVQLYLHNYNGHTAYLLGQYSDFGWWYYFPIALFIKTPIAQLLMLCLLLYVVILSIGKTMRSKYPLFKYLSKINFSYYPLIVVPFVFFVFSMFGHINLGVRHIIIVYAFSFVLCGSLLYFKIFSNRIARIIVGLLLLGYIGAAISIFPHFTAYFNIIGRGPKNGPIYLTDSNIDWGQDVKKLKSYMDTNSIDHVCMSYFGQADLVTYGINYWYIPDNANFQGDRQLDCVVAISVTSLYSREREYSWLLSYEPTARIGYSIYVYDLRNTAHF